MSCVSGLKDKEHEEGEEEGAAVDQDAHTQLQGGRRGRGGHTWGVEVPHTILCGRQGNPRHGAYMMDAVIRHKKLSIKQSGARRFKKHRPYAV